MSKKIIYFVRHGETILNAQNIRQGPDGSLSEKGKLQVKNTARRFTRHKGKPEVIISSPYQRTKETAEIIAADLRMEVEYSDLLVERRNPTEIIGHNAREKKVSQIVENIDNSFHEDNLRYSDEENFIDLKERAKKLLEYIKQRPEKRMIMVTHGIFLKMVVSYMLLGENLTASEYNKLSIYNPVDNASMAIVLYKSHWLRKDEWKILVWNDLA